MNNSHILVSSKKFHNRNKNLLGTLSFKHEEKKIVVFLVRLGMSSFHSLAAHALCSEEWQPGRAAPSSCTRARSALWQRGISPVAAHKFEGTGCLPDGWCYPLGEHMCLTVQGCLQLRFTPAEGRSFPLLAGATCVCPGDSKCWCSLLLRDCMAACAGSQILIHLCLVSIYCNI